MRYKLTVAAAMLLLGCESKKAATEQPAPSKPSATRAAARAPLTDLTALAPVRVAFNAKKGEARFLTLLSPT